MPTSMNSANRGRNDRGRRPRIGRSSRNRERRGSREWASLGQQRSLSGLCLFDDQNLSVVCGKRRVHLASGGVVRPELRREMLLSSLTLGRVRIPDAALRFGVSVRTLQRDIARLREAGYAIASAPGPRGGVWLAEWSRPAPVTMEVDRLRQVVVHLAATGAPRDATRAHRGDTLPIPPGHARGRAPRPLAAAPHLWHSPTGAAAGAGPPRYRLAARRRALADRHHRDVPPGSAGACSARRAAVGTGREREPPCSRPTARRSTPAERPLSSDGWPPAPVGHRVGDRPRSWGKKDRMTGILVRLWC